MSGCRPRSGPAIWVLLCAFLLPTAVTAFAAEEQHEDTRGLRHSVSIDDMARRAQLPLAAISPNGRNVAYLSIRGDPASDTYEALVRVADLRSKTDQTLTAYQLDPDEAFDEFENLQPSAGLLYWISNNALLYVTKVGERSRLALWDPSARQSRELTTDHDRIALSGSMLREVITMDCVSGRGSTNRVLDNSWRILDDYRFHGRFQNPKLGKRCRSQHWTLIMQDVVELRPAAPAEETWEAQPIEWSDANASIQTDETVDESVYVRERSAAPDTPLSAVVEAVTRHMKSAGAGEAGMRIVALSGSQRDELVPFQSAPSVLALLGWRKRGAALYFLRTDSVGSTISSVDLKGNAVELYREPAALRKACSYASVHCQSTSDAGELGVLVRSSNLAPDELVIVDLKRGTLRPIYSPNASFVAGELPEVRLYSMEGKDGRGYGRLYLPAKSVGAPPYPLVFTLYVSGPGFNAAVGDEVPILPLLGRGIAVFTFDARKFNQISDTGDFQAEIDRVNEPLQAIEWIRNKLVSEGVVDPTRVGLTGLSYGAEIGMYAYWRSTAFRAISLATTSWEPSIIRFGGLAYAKSLEQRGFPFSYDEAAFRQWEHLSAAMHASAARPPLLLQSPDEEQTLIVPTWFALRRSGAAVEWYEYPNEGHVKRSPANKWWVYQRNLDWFRFWLQNEEDPDSSKSEQYLRWRAFRMQHSSDAENQASPNSTPASKQ